MLTDTHCHIDFEVFDQDRNQILQNCLEKNIRRIIVPSVKSACWKNTLNLCSAFNSQILLIPALGLHPFFLAEHSDSDLALLERYCETGELNAIGEIGLDYLYLKQRAVKQELNKLDKQKQLFYFERQLYLAQKYHLPILIHARKSHQDIIQLLKNYTPLKGIIHAFNGSKVQANQYIDLGFVLGFGGAFTSPRANHLRQLVKELPLNSMVLETDAPDMLPFFALKNSNSPRNSPENLSGIFDEFILLRNEKQLEVELQLEKNIINLFPHMA